MNFKRAIGLTPEEMAEGKEAVSKILKVLNGTSTNRLMLAVQAHVNDVVMRSVAKYVDPRPGARRSRKAKSGKRPRPKE